MQWAKSSGVPIDTVIGPSGVGKTASTRRILMDLEELPEADGVAKVFNYKLVFGIFKKMMEDPFG